MNQYNMDPIQIGKNLREAREAKGWSQNKLAEEADTTFQNISKFENKGVADITWINTFSNILGRNLLENVIDAEVKVSELGKEILNLIIKCQGFTDFFNINTSMYGLNEEQVTNEIVKLNAMGLIRREIYISWDGYSKDMIFITAKGIITYKNMDLNGILADELNENIENVDTYEYLLSYICFNSFGTEPESVSGTYQEYVEKNKCEKAIRNVYNGLEFEDSDFIVNGKIPLYRVNYIRWLKENFEYGIEKDFSFCNLDLDEDDFFVGENIYHDILYRMIFGLSDEDIINRLKGIKEAQESVETDVLFFDLVYCEDSVVDSTFKKIREKVLQQCVEEQLEKEGFLHMEDVELYSEDKFSISKKAEEKEEEYKTLKFNECIEDISKLPSEWFSKEDFEKFINENFREAKFEYEKEIDKRLGEINQINEYTLSYYNFPEEWEENGLASLVRKKIGLE